MRIGDLDTHPAADAFPMLDGPEHVALVEDIRRRGQIDPVTVDAVSGLLVDGRNRARACAELAIAVERKPVAFGGDAAVVDFVVSRNLHRRHLNPSQRAIVASRLATLSPGERKQGEAAVTQAESASLLRVSERQVRKARALEATGRTDLVDAVAKGAKTLNRAVREANRDASAAKLRAEALAPPTGKFRVVALDPPWRYAKNHDVGPDADRRGEVDYPDMSCAEIVDLDVPQYLEDDAVVLLWTTNAHLPEAVDIARSWGLEWKTVLTWVKNKMGTGDWLRGKTEHCVILTRGSPTVTLTNQTTELRADAREHSRKPVEFYDLVDKLFPGTKLELFARETREGWTTHGVDVGKFPSEPVQRDLPTPDASGPWDPNDVGEIGRAHV